MYLNCCDIIQDTKPELAKYGRDYINKGANMMRHLRPPPKEEKPYPIHDKHILELASKHVVNLYDEKKILGPFRENKLPPRTNINVVFAKMKDAARQKIYF